MRSSHTLNQVMNSGEKKQKIKKKNIQPKQQVHPR